MYVLGIHSNKALVGIFLSLIYGFEPPAYGLKLFSWFGKCLVTELSCHFRSQGPGVEINTNWRSSYETIIHLSSYYLESGRCGVPFKSQGPGVEHNANFEIKLREHNTRLFLLIGVGQV